MNNGETVVLDSFRHFEKNAQPEVQAWLQEQANETETHLKKCVWRDELKTRFETFFGTDEFGVPEPRGSNYFFRKKEAGEELGKLFVQEGLTGKARVLVDSNTLSVDKTTTLGGWLASPDGKLLMYEISRKGNDKSEIRVMDVATATDLPDVILDDSYPHLCAWSADASGFWYIRRDPYVVAEEGSPESKLYRRVFYHTIGSDPAQDELVFGGSLQKEDWPWVIADASGRYVLVNVESQDELLGREQSTVYLKDLSDNEEGFVLAVSTKLGASCFGFIHRDKLYIRTNEDAPRWRLVRMDIKDILQGGVSTEFILPETENMLEQVVCVGDNIFASYLENVSSVIKQYDLDGTFLREVPLPTLGYVEALRCEDEGKELFFSFESFTYPFMACRLDLSTGNTSVFAKEGSLSSVEDLETKQVWYSSKDGTKIPMFLVHRKDITLDGNNPTVLYGYGGFDISITPYFLRGVIPFLKQGGVYAIANIRGGGEFGQAWHEAGMQKNKQNVFDDFASAVEHLIATGYTNSNKVAVWGGSNGGLLTMATITQHPNLVKVAIADVPVTDMLRFHLFFGGAHWIPDYGNPDDEEMMEYLLRYSPYHNVRDGEKYPAVFIVTADSDDRVHPMHSYKMTARLKQANVSDNPILLRVELGAGHGGANAVSKTVKKLADVWSFIFEQLGVVH